jgi:uncharacterized protein DUF4440
VSGADLAEVERQRLRALVDADLTAADQLHADEFQLITPGGDSLTKEEYLAGIASGEIDYVMWEPEQIEERVCGDAGCLRYRSMIEIIVGGHELGRTRCWHTDYYEKRGESWQIVWSQATATAG